jgi:phospholipase/lecithinase/hemolysin
MNYLANGNGITAAQAKSRFGVGNLRATISSIKSQVEAYGNWEIVSEETATGKTRYFMDDVHPGKRTYGFDKFGNRYAL